MADMHLYKVGALYIPGRTSWPEAGEYNFRSDTHELRLFVEGLTAEEVETYRHGRLELGLYVSSGVIFILYRFGNDPWSDAPYSWWLVPEGERSLPEGIPTPESWRLLSITVVEATTGIIEVLREVSMSPQFTVALQTAIQMQASKAFDRAVHDKAIALAYRMYPHSNQMAQHALIKCIAGED